MPYTTNNWDDHESLDEYFEEISALKEANGLERYHAEQEVAQLLGFSNAFSFKNHIQVLKAKRDKQ